MKPPSAPGVTHTKALSGRNSSELDSAFTSRAIHRKVTISRKRGAPRRTRHIRVSAAPVIPQAVMMVSDSQYCSTVMISSPGRSMATRSMSMSSQRDSQLDTIGSTWPWPNR